MKKKLKSYGAIGVLWLLTLGVYLFFNIKTNSYPWQNNIQIARHSIDYALGFISFCIFLALLIKLHKYLRIVVYIFVLLLFINTLTSASCYFIYNSLFDPQMAYNIIVTDYEETTSFISTLSLPIIISLLFIILFSLLIEKLALKIKFNIFNIIFSITWIIIPFFWLQKEIKDMENYRKNYPDRLGIRLVKSKTIFYNYYEFYKGYKQLQDINSILLYPTDFSHITHIKTDNYIDKIIVLVGESARKQNMSIYGYFRNTTPIAIKEKQNMLLFNNAVSPAPYTHQAVPLSLSSIGFDDYANKKYTTLNNNIISVSRKFNYTPYWIAHRFSPEERLLNNEVEDIIITSGYDDANLLPPLKKLMKNQGKQLIVVHLWGSHSDAKNNYPLSHEVFKEKNSLDEYDNSITYTDYLLGNIFKEYQNTNTAIVYYSDHGQEYNYGKFFHAQTQSANQVPLWIWYGNKVPKEFRKTGVENQQVSTRIVYELVLELMSLKNATFEPASPAKFLENGKVVLFKDLKQ